MKKTLQVKLLVNDEQSLKLSDLQKTFAAACEEAALFVSSARCWHRVTLHHLSYKKLREKFPALGSQMVCNAIHTVSRACKEIYQDPDSPWITVAKSGQPLPTLKFTDTTPVFFDKHTLTLNKKNLSLFTLDGRMHIQINLSEEIEKRIRHEKLKELSLIRKRKDFYLRFVFSEDLENVLQISTSVKIISTSRLESIT